MGGSDKTARALRRALWVVGVLMLAGDGAVNIAKLPELLRGPGLLQEKIIGQPDYDQHDDNSEQ
jgi:hypothetical protein